RLMVCTLNECPGNGVQINLLIKDHLIPEAISVEFKIIFNSLLRPKDFYELVPKTTNPIDDDHFEAFP
ncbi:MAG TPA: hypothetical protein PK129_05595, partial [Cellvibrionaceae bacterium]|nr:hypothetical protein [Cellvibrionaceae bacterium]